MGNVPQTYSLGAAPSQDEIVRNIITTPPKINIKPENYGSEDDFPFPGVYSQVACSSSRVYIFLE